MLEAEERALVCAIVWGRMEVARRVDAISIFMVMLFEEANEELRRGWLALW